MRHRYRHAIWSLILTCVVGVAALALTFHVGPRWLWTLLFAPAWPAWLLVMFLGLGTGAHGTSGIAEPLPHIFTFLGWWAVFAAIGKARGAPLGRNQST
jgi:hypothetical protein